MSSSSNVNFDEWIGATEPQRRFYMEAIKRERSICLYGGAGGGGKSWGLRYCLVKLAMAYASLGYGGQRLVLACADYPRLRDRHTGKFLEEYRQFGTVKTSQTHGLGFHFSNEEFGVIAFRNLQEPDRFRGTECAALAVDEATELPEVIGGLGVLETLKYPIRSSMGLPFAPLLMGSNPDGVGHKWVKGLFITRTGIPKGDDESRYVYVPALPNDNPYLFLFAQSQYPIYQ